MANSENSEPIRIQQVEATLARLVVQTESQAARIETLINAIAQGQTTPVCQPTITQQQRALNDLANAFEPPTVTAAATTNNMSATPANDTYANDESDGVRVENEEQLEELMDGQRWN